MRAVVQTEDRGTLPVNMYVINLAVSGSGKGYSTNIIEEQLINGFRDRFLNDTFRKFSEQNLAIEATNRANRDQKPLDYWKGNLRKEFETLGPLPFSFDSATVPAIKQLRHKLLLSNAGSMNLEIDEIGSSFLSNNEIFSSFLELFDKGLIKQKLLKNTAENIRMEEIIGTTPTNLMLFGTPIKLLDGTKTEEEFKSMLEAGFARRCFFGYSNRQTARPYDTAEQLYDILVDTSINTTMEKIYRHLANLASPSRFNNVLQMEKAVTIEMLRYKLRCEDEADKFQEHQEIFKIEMSHRYYKALKLAAAYAFVDDCSQVTKHHLDCAIQLTEDSGENFCKMMNKEGPYVRLAHYLADVNQPVTHVDMIQDLPFFKGSKADKTELIQLATAYGYQNNIMISKQYIDDIELLSGEYLQETDLNAVQVSFSKDLVNGYKATTVPFNEMHKLTTSIGYHYCSHKFTGDYRTGSNAIPGFNMVILDIDSGLPLRAAQGLLKDYQALYSHTKRSIPKCERYRILLPISHVLKLQPEDYTKFMENVFNWLPFETDSQAKDIARKWESFPGKHIYQDGKLLDATQFIPKTARELQNHQKLKQMSNMDRMERWFGREIEVGNRSNMMIRYAFVLIDSGKPADEVKEAIRDFNKKLTTPLNKKELEKTIFVSIDNKINQKP